MSAGSSSSQKLRQKAISLLYLLFIALVFIYVPADFLDSINDTNRSLEKTSKELSELKKNKFIMYEKSGFQFELGGLQDSFKYKKVSQLSDSLYNHIQDVKDFLVEETGGYNEYGYPRKSKEFDVTDHLMLNTGRAGNLKKAILDYRNDIKTYLEPQQKAILDSILVIKEQILSSKGKLVNWEQFYFKKAPLSVTQMMLSKFQSEVRLVEYLILDKYDRKFLESVFIQSNAIDLRVGQSDSSGSISIIELKPIERTVRAGSTIRVEIDTTYEDLVEFDSLSATYRVNGGAEKVARIDKTQKVIEIPANDAGTYRIRVEDASDSQSGETVVTVLSSHPVINRKELEVLYIGIRNPLRIEIENFDLEDVELTSTSGTIRRINNLYYIKPDREGEITINATAQIDNEEQLVSTRVFYARELPLPYAILNSLRSGSILDVNMKEQRKLLIKSDIYETENYYNVTQFRLTRVSADGYTVNRIRDLNRTANFGASVLELVKEARKGDMYIFNEIEVVGANGERRKLQALVFNVI